MWKRLPLWAKIIIGMALGLIWGMIATRTGLNKFTIDWIKPWGTIFLKLLKLIAVPLIFVSLVKGISSLTDISKLSRIGVKTITYYMVSTLIATTFGLLLVNTVKPGNTFPEEKRAEFMAKWQGTIDESQLLAESSDHSPLRFIEDIVPDNIISAMGDNSQMLQIIFFAILFAVSMVLVKESQVKTVKYIFDGLNDIIIKIIELIMLFAPYGVFALLAGVVVDFAGDTDIFVALGKYFVTVMVGLFVLILVLYPTYLKIFTRKISVGKFLKAVLPAQMVAFSTSSSAAALPVNMRQNTEELGVSEEVANFVLPVGVTINMDATAFYQSVAAVFIAQVYGIDLTIAQQITIVLMATMSSIGSPGVPGGSIVLVIMVLTSVGLPVEGLALILGVDRPLDMLRSSVNITGDSTIANIINYSEQKRNNKLVISTPDPQL
ncbi:MAG: dicarboxylate/amino acid:cation symporter [Bacteroidales bacterium]|nr:dicarboxylate/amino acid:cation symporter [Bacteroidales bacterium]